MAGIEDYANRTEGLIPESLGDDMRALAVLASRLASISDGALRAAEDAQIMERDHLKAACLEPQIQKCAHHSAWLWEVHRKARRGAVVDVDKIAEREATICADFGTVLKPEIHPPIG